jgi:hypothetical protein
VKQKFISQKNNKRSKLQSNTYNWSEINCATSNTSVIKNKRVFERIIKHSIRIVSPICHGCIIKTKSNVSIEDSVNIYLNKLKKSYNLKKYLHPVHPERLGKVYWKVSMLASKNLTAAALFSPLEYLIK